MLTPPPTRSGPEPLQADEADQARRTQLLRKFIASQRILIADPSPASRVGLAKTLISLGATPASLTLADSYEWGIEALARVRPTVVICEYDLGKCSGLDLIEQARKAAEARAEEVKLTLIVTQNTSQGAVARSAEGDVDAYITKPYSMDGLRQVMETAVQEKLFPSEYIREINDGRQWLQSSELDRAMESFTRAKSLSPHPALACFYEGQANTQKKSIDSAMISFAEGLRHNRQHYRCLLGLYETLLEQGREEAAYQAVKRLTRQFPLNPDRFGAVLRLAVRTGHFDDIENFYAAFLEIDGRNEDLIKHVCAALIVAAKHSLKAGDLPRGVRLLQRAALTAVGRISFLRQIVFTLIENGQAAEADRVLKRLPPEERGQTPCLALDYYVLSHLSALNVALGHGRKLLREGHRDPLIHRVLIQASARAGFADTAEQLASDGAKLWPLEAESFARAAREPKQVAPPAAEPSLEELLGPPMPASPTLAPK